VASGPARTVFIGTGPFGVDSLRRLSEPRNTGLIEVVGVVAAPGRPAGRRATIEPSPIERTAREVGIPTVLTLSRLRDPDAIAAVLALRPDLVVLADYGRIVPPPILDVPFGALNLHPSLLPRHRGAAPIPATILAGETRTGVTLIRMDAGIDTGPIVAVARVALAGTEAAPELEARLAGVAADLLEASLPAWLAGAIDAVAQDADAATLTRPLRREDGRLDPGRLAWYLERQVRALRPWPGTFIEVAGLRVAVLEARVVAAGDEHASSASTRGTPGTLGTPRTPGTLTRRGPDLVLVTADGTLELRVVQPSGGRPMSGADLLRGRPELAGAAVAGPSAGAGDLGPLEHPVR